MRGDIISAKDFSRVELQDFFDKVSAIKKEAKEGNLPQCGKGKALMTVFLEPSTRTRLSFQLAMIRLGGEIVDFGQESETAIAKGESFEDTIRTLDELSPDIIVLRSDEPYSTSRAAEIARAPVINAGDGSNEHPTQALLDAYTILDSVGRLDDLRIAMVGDLKYGRTPSSLCYLMAKFNNVTTYFVAPEDLQIRDDVTGSLDRMKWHKCDRLDEVPEPIDVLYVTRLQRERMPYIMRKQTSPEKYMITPEYVHRSPHAPIIMHPLPRIGEISTEVDSLPQAKYFDQVRNGLFVRIALIIDLLGFK